MANSLDRTAAPSRPATARGGLAIGTESDPSEGGGNLEDLLNLVDVDSDALREWEWEQTQSILDTMLGKTVVKAEIEAKRIVIETSDGNRYFFFGFMSGGPHET